MKISLGAGHTYTGKGSGAIGFINESQENRIMFGLVKKWLELDKNTVYDCTIEQSDNYLPLAVKKANAQKVDVAFQIHFNANKDTQKPMGTETLYVSPAGKVIAERVNKKLGTKFEDRGVCYRDNLYWLNHCDAPTILTEVCFVDSGADVDIYKNNKDAIAKLIAEGIVGHNIIEPVKPIVKDGYQIGEYQKDVLIDCKSTTLNARSGRGINYPAIGAFQNKTKVNIWRIDKAEDGSLWGSCSCNGKTSFIHMGYTKKI